MQNFSFLVKYVSQPRVYTNIFDFIFDLFENKYSEKREMDDFILLKSYMNEFQITSDELEYIKILIKENYKNWEKWIDTEYASYKLLNQIINKNVLVLINSVPIINFEESLQVPHNAIISFIDINRIKNIKFK